jgi:hypothetical protein
MTNTIIFSSASMFSYLTISRSPVFLYAPSTVTVSLSTLQRVNGNFVWNDVSVNASTPYTYTITPFVSGNGASPTTTLITSGIAHGPPTALLLSSSYSYNSPNEVLLSWTGGLGDNVVLTYTRTSGTANSTTGNLTYNVAGGSAVLSVTGSGPWIYNVTATNSKGSTTSSITTGDPLLTNLLYWYKFNSADQIGSTVKDFVTGTYNATFVGTSSISTAKSKFGTASLYVNGYNSNSDYCSLPSFTFDGTNGMTIAFWTYVVDYGIGSAPFKFATSSSVQFNNPEYLGYYGKTLRPWYGFGGVNQNTITRFVVDTDNIDMEIMGSTITIMNQWNHIAYVFSGTAISIYVNGTLYGNVNFHYTLQNGTYPWFVIGDNNGNGGQNAYFDDFRVYNTQLASTQITAIYNYAGN